MFDLLRRFFGGKKQEPSVRASAAVRAPMSERMPAPPSAAAAPAATADPGGPATGDVPVATEASLNEALRWRAKALLDGASREALGSDGAILVEVLRRTDDSVVRQPPQAALRALNLARNPNTPMPLVVELFENDPMLAQSLLRQANSSYYRRDEAPCASLPAAVQRVGMRAVTGILTASMVQQLLCRPGGAYDTQVQQVWSHMQRTAPIARAIAPAFQVDAEAAYSLALLHDVGKLLVFDRVSTLRHDRRREVKVPPAFFRDILWCLHEPLGGIAALRWDMGGEAAHVIAAHHRCPRPERPDRMTECIHVAEAVDLAHTNFTKLDWESLWVNGHVTTDMVSVVERLRGMEE